MALSKSLIALCVATFVYTILCVTAGRDGIFVYEKLQAEKRRISVETSYIQKINDELSLEKTALEKDKDVLASFARKLDYIGNGEKLVKITGLRPYQSRLYDTGTIVKHTEGLFLSEEACKLAGLAFFILSFALLSLLPQNENTMATRKKL